MATRDIRTHEVTFCSRVAKWAEAIFSGNAGLPFRRAEIEESKGIRRKRSDLRIYDDQKRLVLAGEVKFPGTSEGRDPFHHALVEDAFQKADRAGAQFFFTWNVNHLVLFDRSLWERPLFERRVRDWDLGLNIESPDDVSRPDVEAAIQRFLAQFFGELSDIVSGRKPDWGMPPDEYFVRAFESHIAWPVKLTADFLMTKAEGDKAFDTRLQEWMAMEQGWVVIRRDPQEWRNLIDRAASSLCYVFSNRLIFYESVRVKFTNLKPLAIPSRVHGQEPLCQHFQRKFQDAVEVTGDYETLFYPLEKEWAAPHIFGHPMSAEAWRSVLENLKPFNFKLIPADILGGIFKRFISPEERRKFGQHYTNQDIVDVINALCIRKGSDAVLDPACGSGSFLVRAYHRKAWLDNARFHQELLGEIYGADISTFAAHISTLNLASRDVRDEENYPLIARRNFFEIAPDKPFCHTPRGLRGERRSEPVTLPGLDAVVGNPPYVRQEKIPKRGQHGVKTMQAKEDLQELCASAKPGVKLSGRSDLHCYFWPASCRYLKEKGWFGFVTSSSWLDVEYGFALQAWILQNFKLHAIIESTVEPWFEDARVKTCTIIMQRCDDERERMANLVKFVRLDRPLAEILGDRHDENSRQKAAEKFRDMINRAKEDLTHRDDLRIIVKGQGDLWAEGLRAGELFAKQTEDSQEHKTGAIRETASLYPNETAGSGDDENGDNDPDQADCVDATRGGYGGGKWGKHLRAPEFYFRIMRDYGNRFVPLGEIAKIRRGVTSGCDAFFMPRDISQKFLNNYGEKEWRNVPLYTHCKRSEVENGEVKLILAGDGTVHPIESRFLAPEVHSLMEVTRPIVAADGLDHLILLVSDRLSILRGTYMARYLRYGETHTFASTKSKAVPVAQRSTCAARDPWYDLTHTKRGDLIWPKSQQYRHIVVHNGKRLVVNCNLYDVFVRSEAAIASQTLAAVLNSTLIALLKTFYGRYAGTEGNLKTEIVDVNLMEVPDPRGAAPAVMGKLKAAFEKLCARDNMHMVEDEFMACHSSERARKLAEKPVGLPRELTMLDRRELDLAVFELLGVADAQERERLCDELHHATSAHFRQIRVAEIQKQEQRSRTEGREFMSDELAADIWDGLAEEEKTPLAKWLAQHVADGLELVIPEGKPSLPDATDMLEANTVHFAQGRDASRKLIVGKLDCPTRSHAELIALLAAQSVHGTVHIPKGEKDASALLGKATQRIEEIQKRSAELAASRTSDARRTHDVAGILIAWMLRGVSRSG
ncbi:MAG: SAM-dependent DNA methyltransferase [Verrucomicrobia bacterium]|nr:SAM-dependent DNA methyltransferase [Verrucomicrobiota bacterium]